jgi:hypothetical protein
VNVAVPLHADLKPQLRTMLQGGTRLLAGADVAHDLVKLLRIHLRATLTHNSCGHRPKALQLFWCALRRQNDVDCCSNSISSRVPAAPGRICRQKGRPRCASWPAPRSSRRTRRRCLQQTIMTALRQDQTWVVHGQVGTFRTNVTPAGTGHPRARRCGCRRRSTAPC